MAAQVSGASLAEIYERLNSATAYHPMEAETFSDWSMEAGDTVTVTRGEESYQSPIHTTRMVWKGAPQVSISSSGKKERDAVARVGQRKYARGGAGMRNQQGFRYDFYSEDGYLHSVIEASASSIRTEVGETISGMAHSIIEQTATYIRTEVENAASSISRSVIEQTASYVRTEVSSIASGVAWSVVEQTMTGIIQEVGRKAKIYRQWSNPNDGINELHDGDIWVKVRDERTWNDVANMTWEDISDRKWKEQYGALIYTWNAAKSAWVEVLDTAPIVESKTWVEQDSERYAILAHQMDINGQAYDSNLTVTAQKISSEVHTAKSEVYSSIAQTATSITSRVENVRQGLQSNIEQTAEGIRTSVSAANSALYSTIQVTATNIYTRVTDETASKYSTIEQTATMIFTKVVDENIGQYSTIEQTASKIRSMVVDENIGNYSTIEQTASKIRSMVVDQNIGNYSTIEQTASKIRSMVVDQNIGNFSTIEQTASKIQTMVVDQNIGGYSTISQTATMIYTKVVDQNIGGYSTISQTSTKIYTMVVDQNIGKYSTITQTSTDIAIAVANSEASMQGKIDVQAARISLVVEGGDDGTNARIKPAEIVAAINGQGQSEVKISANRIKLDGYVTSTMLTGEYISTRLASAANLSVRKLSIQSGGTLQWSGSNTIITDANAADIIRNLKIERNGNTYTLSKITCGDGSWSTVGTFSRAVDSWSVGGGNGRVNVTANPQGQTRSVNISISGGNTISSNGTYVYKAMYENSSGDDIEIGGNATKTITVNVPAAQTISYWNVSGANGKLNVTAQPQNQTKSVNLSISGSNTITNNGTYTYKTMYEDDGGDDRETGANKTITVNIAGTAINSWTVTGGSSKVNVRAYPQNQEKSVNLSISGSNVITRNGTYTYKTMYEDSAGDDRETGANKTITVSVSASSITSWTVSGGSSKVNVTAQPQNQTKTVNLSISGSNTITSNGTYTYKTMYEDSAGNDQETGANKTVTVNVPASPITSWNVSGGSSKVNVTAQPQNQTKTVNLSISGSNTIISNGTYTYKTMYEDSAGNDQETGANKTITVNVPASTITSWTVSGGGSKVNVKANPQNQTKSVNLSISGSNSITSNGTYTYKTMYVDENGDDQETGANKTVSINVTTTVSSWTVTGGSSKINVKANPQNQTKSVTLSISGSNSITSNGTYTYKTMYEDENGDDQETGANKTVTINVPDTGWQSYYDSGYWAKATEVNAWYAKIPKRDKSGSENWDCGAATAYSLGHSRGVDAGYLEYYSGHNDWWKKPTENNGVCTIPNSTKTGPETWFSMSYITLTNVGWHSTSGTIYNGKLYYWDDDDQSYQPVYNGNAYWYRSSYRKSGSTTFYY